MGLPYSTAIDLWSAGCILAELAIRMPLFNTSDPAELLPLMTQHLGHAPSSGPALEFPRLRELQQTLGTDCPDIPPLYDPLEPLGTHLAQLVVFGLLRFDPAHRLTAEEAMTHPFCFESMVRPRHTHRPLSLQAMTRGVRKPGALFSRERVPPARAAQLLRESARVRPVVPSSTPGPSTLLKRVGPGPSSSNPPQLKLTAMGRGAPMRHVGVGGPVKPLLQVNIYPHGFALWTAVLNTLVFVNETVETYRRRRSAMEDCGPRSTRPPQPRPRSRS